MASIRKRKDRWQVQVRRSGSQFLSRTFHHRRDAEQWARQMEVKADRRDLPADLKVLQQITLGNLVVRYRDTITPRKKGAFVESVVLNRFLHHPICLKPLSDLRTADFAVYRDERLRDISPVSLRRQLNPICHLFTVARKDWGLPIYKNPIQELQLEAHDKRRERRLRPGELDRLLEAAQRCRNNFVYPAVMLALETAMRRGELLALEVTDIDWEGRALIIRDSKNGSGRIIPMSKKAGCVLGNLNRQDGSILPITGNALRLAWNRVRRQAGISDLNFHDLRHEAISRLFEKGLTVPEVALISGHKDVRMLFRYSHPLRNRVLEKLDAET